MQKIQKFEKEIGKKKFIIEIGKFAWQADAAVTCQYGDTVILATVVKSKKIREGIDYLPLTIEYEERLYAGGKIKGSRFIKRETRPSDEAILTGRLIDRSIRPLFDQNFRNEIQIILTTLSWDEENDADIPSFLAVSIALSLTDLPWSGPIAGLRIGRKDNEFIINPSYSLRKESDLDLVVAGARDNLLMIEAGSKVVPEEIILEAISFGQKYFGEVIDFVEEIKKTFQKENSLSKEKIIVSFSNFEKVKEKAKDFLKDKLYSALFVSSSEEREENLKILKEKFIDFLKEQDFSDEERKKALSFFEEEEKELFRKEILENEKRVDGRKLDQIRPLNCQAKLLPRTHGSAIFSRGETQVLSIITLGSPSDELFVDTLEEKGKRRFMLHYNFPPFCSGETGSIRSTSRREIGHGALAEKAIFPLVPEKEIFPHTIRIVAEVLSSNGSTSMASTCASSLALMDAGVPLKDQVAGIAMGVIIDNQNYKKYKILTDIQGIEDHEGDMDFKVAGTKDGITALQMDVKSLGINLNVLKEALAQAKKARLEILEEMNKALSAPREKLSIYAPKIISLQINPDRIRDVVGPQGRIINEIINKTGVMIDIEQTGLVMITSQDEEALKKAKSRIEDLTHEVKVGETFQGTVTRIVDFGAFVEILPGQEGLVHISQMADYHVNRVQDIVKMNDIVPVKVIQIDELGRINLSMSEAKNN